MTGLSLQHFSDPVTHPVFKFLAAFRLKNPARIPQIFDDMNNINDNGQLHFPFLGHASQQADLRLVAINKGDPGFFVSRIPEFGFLKQVFDDLLGRLFHTGPHPFMFRLRAMGI